MNALWMLPIAMLLVALLLAGTVLALWCIRPAGAMLWIDPMKPITEPKISYVVLVEPANEAYPSAVWVTGTNGLPHSWRLQGETRGGRMYATVDRDTVAEVVAVRRDGPGGTWTAGPDADGWVRDVVRVMNDRR